MNKLSAICDKLNGVAKYSSLNFNEQKAKDCFNKSYKALYSVFSRHAWNPIIHQAQLEEIKNKLETVKKNQLSFSKTEEFTRLESAIQMIFNEGVVKEQFKATPYGVTLSQRLQAPFAALFRFLTKRISNAISIQIYQGWSQKIQDKKIKELVQKEFEEKYANWAKREKAKTTDKRDVKHINDRLADELGAIPQEIAKNEAVKKADAIKKKAKETRELFMDVAGKRVELTTADNVKLDATYLSAKEFKKTLQNNKCMRIGYVVNNQNISALAFPGNCEAFMETLKKLNVVGEDSAYGIIQAVIENNGDNVPVIASMQDILDGVAKGNIAYDNGEYTFKKNYKYTKEDIDDWEINHNGVAILSSGNRGVYEMHKGEALTLLMNGCDVMLLNLRGFGGSEGEPTEQGTYQDVEAAYQYVKKHRPNIRNDDIVAWSMCLSGGVAAHLAETHQGMHLFLNQTYANFWDLIKRQVHEGLNEFLRRNVYSRYEQSKLRKAIQFCLVPLAMAAIKRLSPNYDVKNRLPKIKGKICIIEAENDEIMTKAETQNMKAAIQGKNVDCSFVNIPGGHCTAWNKVVKFKNSNGASYDPQNYFLITTDQNKKMFVDISLAQKPQGYLFNIDKQKYTAKARALDDGNYKISIKDANGSNIAISKIVPVTSDVYPLFLKRFKLTANYIGLNSVKKFLDDAALGQPLI